MVISQILSTAESIATGAIRTMNNAVRIADERARSGIYAAVGIVAMIVLLIMFALNPMFALALIALVLIAAYVFDLTP